MRAIDKKLWRDLWHMRAQAMAIILVIMSGVAVFIMFISTLDSLYLTRANYYQEYRFAHVFSTLKRAPDSLLERIEDIPGTARVETRVVVTVNLDIPGYDEPVTGRLVSIPDSGQPLLNLLHLRQGRLVEQGRDNEAVISEAFATEHGFVPGDKVHAIINGRRKALHIVGIAMSPEYVYQLRPGGVFPDYERYSIIWMGRTALGNAYDLDGAFNDVVLSLAANVNEKDVIERLDNLLEPYGGRGAYAREHQLSNNFLTEELKTLNNNASIFPVIFLAVAVFLLNVVVGRLIAMQREQIAALKAFGYSNLDVAMHYSKLVVVIVISGVLMGVLTGVWLGQGMSELYMDFFSFPYLHYQLTPATIVKAALINTLAAMAGTLFAVRAAVRLRPAEAMRPEPPSSYSVSVVERMGIKRLLSQPNRMIIRHIQRRPVKSLLSVIGIAMACGIMMTGRFQQDTISYMMYIQYGLMQREDISLTFVEPTSRKAIFELKNMHGVKHVEAFRTVPVRLRFQHRNHRTAIHGVSPDGDIKRLFDAKLKLIKLPDEGIVLTDFLGKLLGVKAGDRLTVEVLEGNRPVRELTVVGLVNEYMGARAYMNLASLNRFMREGQAISGVYLAVDDSEKNRLFRKFKDMPRIAGTLEREQEIKNFYKTMNETMIFITSVATVFAMVIAFGVVYNSARISLTERSRELASLRVLGFTRAEISYILLGELTILTLLAIIPGFLIGEALCGLIASALQSELYRVPVVLETQTYAFAATVVILSAVISGLVVRRRLDKLDLIAVLKTKE